MKRRTERAKARKAKRSSKHVPQTSKYAEKKLRQLVCSDCKGTGGLHFARCTKFAPIRDSQNWYDKP